MCVFTHLMYFILSYIYNILNIIYYLIMHFIGIFMTFCCDIVYFSSVVSFIFITFEHLNRSVLFKLFYLLLKNTKIINQYRITYTLCSGLNHVNYLNIIKRDHVSATVRTRLHLASGWSLDHSGA